MPDVDLSVLTKTENLLLGLAAGATTKLCNYPLLNIKNHVQQGVPFPKNPMALYRGLPMAMINLSGTTGLQFLFTGYFQKLLAGGGDLGTGAIIGGALLGGAASGLPCSFYELTMIQQQRFGGSLVGTPVRLVQSQGWGVLLRGSTMTVGREGLYTLAMLGITPVIQQRLADGYGLDR